METMETMLINVGDHDNEIRIALVKGTSLYDLYIESPSSTKQKSTICKGVITRIEPSLEAVFVDYGSQKQGFLPIKEISRDYFLRNPDQQEGGERPGIKDLLREGMELMIQIDKEERGTKGAALTTYITLAGCYLVLMPNSHDAGGISRRIEGDEREEMREILNQLNIPAGMSVIIRTAGLGRNIEDLQWDFDVLLNQWNAINEAYSKQSGSFVIYQEGDIILRSIRDNLRKTINEIVIDNADAFVKVKQYIEQIKPDFVQNVKLYQDSIPLFLRHQIEGQIEAAHQRVISLPSGGSVVIDRTEALVAIDINSAKSTGGADIETTALNTNLEAANEIARQLRIRDLGGLVVIDFIDMEQGRNQREVENCLRDALRHDRARVQIGRISRFGLLEMSRQRLRPSLGEASQELCPRCQGRGTIRGISSLVSSILRLIEEAALKENTGKIHAQLPLELATFILNEKRDTIKEIEKRHKVYVMVVPNPYLETPHYKIERFRHDSQNIAESATKPSYGYIQQPEITLIEQKNMPSFDRNEPVIKQITPPQRPQEEQVGFVKRLWQVLFGSESTSSKQAPTAVIPESTTNTSHPPSSAHRHRRPQQSRGGRRHPHHRPQEGGSSQQRQRPHHTSGTGTGSGAKPGGGGRRYHRPPRPKTPASTDSE